MRVFTLFNKFIVIRRKVINIAGHVFALRAENEQEVRNWAFFLVFCVIAQVNTCILLTPFGR